MPSASVVSEGALSEPPPTAIVKLTVARATGRPLASVTFTLSGVVNAVPAGPSSAAVETAVMDVAGPEPDGPDPPSLHADANNETITAE